MYNQDVKAEGFMAAYSRCAIVNTLSPVYPVELMSMSMGELLVGYGERRSGEAGLKQKLTYKSMKN